uniref:Uncharacterized protein n=1 Tax=Chaetoceros debilis TaxID=122233 RepID=A0A7S3PX82_9STRA
MLNYLNALNLIGYVVNVFFTFFSTLIFDIKGPGELSDKYQTIITPTGFIFSIWGVIFIFQGIFTVVQMLKDFRAVDLVQSHSAGVSYWYFITCIAQSAWTILFGKEMILQSTIAMLIILYSLVQIVQNQSSQTNKSAKEFWLLTFPFQIHCGWIFCATMLNINVMAISMGAGGFFQTILALISLGFLGVQAYVSLVGLEAVLTIPSVFAWATLGIFIELFNPNDLILATFSKTVIIIVMVLAIAFSIACITGVFVVAFRGPLEGVRVCVGETTPLSANVYPK